MGKHYEEVSAGQIHRNNLVGLFNAKANSALEEMPKWLDKVVKKCQQKMERSK